MFIKFEIATHQVNSVMYEGNGRYQSVNPELVEMLSEYDGAVNLHMNSGKDIVVVGTLVEVEKELKG